MNKLNKYDAYTTIPSFLGLKQDDEFGLDSRMALEVQNMETVDGALQPAAACTLLSPQLTSPIETLARLYRRWTPATEKELLVAASGGKLYAMTPSASDWTELLMPQDVTAWSSNVWSWVTYEVNPVGSTSPIDVLLMSNAKDGMIMINGNTLAVTQVDTPKKFGIIERYAERIWGGAIDDDPDLLMYSAPFDPTDWEAQTEIPEDGAGEISQPSWDGDSFTSLKAFGSQLIAFKKTRVWRILGTDPGEYAFKEQFGGGAPYPGTIAVDTERILMATKHGVDVYDGLSVQPFYHDTCKDVFAEINANYADQCVACMWHDKYYLAMPMGNSTINNAVLIYDTHEGSWLLRRDVCAEAFLPTTDKLYFTSSTTPGRLWQWQEDSWKTGTATLAATKWVTPWNDLGRKDIVKGGFEVYFQMEVKTAAVALKLSIQTEKKIKTKTFTLSPLTSTQISNNQGFKQKRIHFGGSGRRFRLIIETAAGQPVWRLVGGMLIISETDPD